MTKEKFKWIMKRLPYILKMIHDDINEICVYISKRKERIVIDDDVVAVMDIIDEIIDYEETVWRKTFFIKIKKGYSDIAIIMDSPMERTKYYTAKKDFIEKIYQCCIYKGLVEYEDILKTAIGYRYAKEEFGRNIRKND